MRFMLHGHLIISFFLWTAFVIGFARIAFGSGYEFEGIGVRQVSRAGAATADADDWSTYYWNPGALTSATRDGKKEIGLELFGGNAYAKDSNGLSGLPGIPAIFRKDDLDSPFILGAAGATFPLTEKIGVGIGLYTPLLQGADVEDVSATGTEVDYKSSAGILTTNLSLAYQLTSVFSVGAGINLLYGELKSDTTLRSPRNTLVSHLEGDGTALEGVFGFRYDFHPLWSLGAVYRTGSDVELEGDATASSTGFALNEASPFRFELRHPPTTAVGVAFRPNERWTHTFDFAQTFWNRFSNEIRFERPGVLLANLNNTFDWDNTYKIKLGTRWALSDQTELFGGYSYDRPAVDAGSIDFSTTVDVPMHRVSLGWGRNWTDRFQTTAGAIGGAGTRNEGGTTYMLSGWQGMIESSLRF